MARTISLADLRTRIRRTTDQEGSAFVTDAELTDEINSGIAELWDLLTAADPDWYLVRATLSTTAGTEQYNIAAGVPANIAYLRGVSLQLGADRWLPISSYGLREGDLVESFGEDPYLPLPGGAGRTRYRFMRNGIDGSGATISFRPDPGTNIYRLEYVPGASTLAADGDLVDGINGWEDYVIQRTAIYVRDKADETEAAARHERNLAKLKARIEWMATQRDQGSPPQPARIVGRSHF